MSSLSSCLTAHSAPPQGDNYGNLQFPRKSEKQEPLYGNMGAGERPSDKGSEVRTLTVAALRLCGRSILCCVLQVSSDAPPLPQKP